MYVRCNGPADYQLPASGLQVELLAGQTPGIGGSGPVIALYALAIGLRPIWQGLFIHVNIKTVPKYLLLKSIYQIGIVLLKTALKSLSSVWFTTLFLLSEGLFTLTFLKLKAFTYH